MEEVILDWAKTSGFRTAESPARWRGHLDKLRPARAKIAKGHFRIHAPQQNERPCGPGEDITPHTLHVKAKRNSEEAARP